MQRILEPELMDETEQAMAYANADFEAPHSQVLKLFESEFCSTDLQGDILDLGCGPGDISFRFAYRFPKSSIVGVDGAGAMIRLANERKAQETAVADRITFLEGLIPGAPIPRLRYEAIISNSLLHHLPRPEVLWETLLEHASPGTKIFIVDLFRPESEARARQIAETYTEGEPDFLKRDFYNSLLAAFEPREVEAQLAAVGLSEVTVRVVSDRHLMACGEKA